ncbi:CLUMA_CG014571, isoform A [Clunio marinus]|uniref:CLUMA_CG014571, isoform A n=1 Tax=Clunio marinus TaxID=568069 RepID=A0A1J1IPE4_9DIPT|nr:CLUMA_CG014571, isoform A [Clunio marinus]
MFPYLHGACSRFAKITPTSHERETYGKYDAESRGILAKKMAQFEPNFIEPPDDLRRELFARSIKSQTEKANGRCCYDHNAGWDEVSSPLICYCVSARFSNEII